MESEMISFSFCLAFLKACSSLCRPPNKETILRKREFQPATMIAYAKQRKHEKYLLDLLCDELFGKGHVFTPTDGCAS